MDARHVAAVVTAEVIRNNQRLDYALADQLEFVKDSRDKGLARELSYGVMRWYHRLAFVAALLLNKPLKAKDSDILALIYTGLYQLMFLRVPDHAAIAATVETARKLNKPWATELINAVLRRYQRERTDIETQVSKSDIARISHPAWLLAMVRQQWPDHADGIFDANNQYPPFHLRVNLLKQSRAACLQRLSQSGIDARASSMADTGIVLAKPREVDEIPGFQSGEITVQDFAAQLAAPLLDARKGHRVLDACAAPGGKTAHILEHTPGLQELVAVEIDAARTDVLRSTLARLNLEATVVNADVTEHGSWWDRVPFDRILIDAPCSATGIIRRHPDIKYLRKPDQIGQFTATQTRLLNTLWPLLKPGGRLVYVTCSLLQQEADEQIASFTNKYDDTLLEPIKADWGIQSRFGRHTLPGHDETDGFYYSVIIKTA